MLIPLLLGVLILVFANFIKAQPPVMPELPPIIGYTPILVETPISNPTYPIQINTGNASYLSTKEVDPCLNGRCRRRLAPPVRRPATPPRYVPPATGDIHAAVVATRSKSSKSTKMGYATAIQFEGEFYLVSCAHVWTEGRSQFIVSKGKNIPVTILELSHELDLALLKCPKGLYYMPLNLGKPSSGSPVCLNYRKGVLEGFSGGEVSVEGYVKNGDSGGPIYTEDGLIGIIATYTYENSRKYSGITSGPDANQIAKFIRGLSGSSSPQPVVPEPKPVVPEPKPVVPEPKPQPQQDLDCRRIADINKKDLELLKQRMNDLEQGSKDNALGVQRNKGEVEILQKEVIAQHNKILSMDQSRKDSELRIQRLEQSTASLTKSITETKETLKGKLQFRLRIDQSGRVTGVESR